MHIFSEQMTRLYGVAGGPTNCPASVVDAHGLTRAIVIPFRKNANGDNTESWRALCEVANALQADLGLPSPAVSISGRDGYGLWLSLKTSTPVDQAQAFLDLLASAYLPSIHFTAGAPVELPPCLNEQTGKWAAFINPGLGASFADEPGLDMAPPLAGQAALLDGLQSISASQFQEAMQTLRPAATTPAVAPGAPSSAPPGLLLKDATLEDIVRHLHAMKIEPTFRHLLPA